MTRRRLFQFGAGITGAVVAQSAVANVCSTASQPLGPFFPRPGTPLQEVIENKDPNTPIFLANDNDLTFVQGRTGEAQGERVILSGQLTDENCEPLAGATIIIWQASHEGRYNHQGDQANVSFTHPVTGEVMQRGLDPNFQYWGQTTTDGLGRYQFKTILPGFYPADLNSGWYRPPHIHMMVSALGKPQFVTQMYFEGADIPDNDFIQTLNEQDLLLHKEQMSEEEKKQLVVSFTKNKAEDQLEGAFNLQV